MDGEDVMQCPQCKSAFKTKFLPKFVHIIADIVYNCVYCPKCKKIIIVNKAEVKK